jgi:amino acid adenylation domain-containing protein
VWLDHQVIEHEGGLLLNWDAVEELFPAGMLDDMFDAEVGLLDWLASADWSQPAPALLPAAQAAVREAVNDTAGPVPDRALHEGFFARAAREPGRVALLWGEGESLTYGQLADRALRVGALLLAEGLEPGEPVAVSLPRGADQVVAVLGVLAAGGVYVPVGVDQPAQRRERILRRAGVRLVLSADAEVAGVPDGTRVVALQEAAGVEPLAAPVLAGADELAYVVFTSGSTGEPKGVEVTHRAALNTIDDVNARFGVGAEDSVLAVSALDFDLSVYDLFGLLGVGGRVVVVEEENRRDADAWVAACRRFGVTVWNSVPALLDMALTVADSLASLRLVLVSGDWVGLDLRGRLAAVAPGARMIALGGATEASIWSNFFPVEQVPAHWRSIPYGFPLANQAFRVVDARGRDCPDWVTGELWIGGEGVAAGYRGDAAQTAERFVAWAGRRWYRTGDLGRYWPDGTLEFLGRADHQVKIRGHRIELGEVEAALGAAPGVSQAVAVAVGERVRRLCAFVVSDGDGPDEAELAAFAADRLPPHAIPGSIEVLDALPLTANGKVDRAALAARAGRAEAPGGEDQPPEGELECLVAEVWAELLDLPFVGRGQSFIALGGDSVLATQLVAALRRRTGAEVSLQEFFTSPTVSDLAAAISRQRSEWMEEGLEEGAL